MLERPVDIFNKEKQPMRKTLAISMMLAAALGLAALQTGAYRPQPRETVALILCGANCDPASLA